MNDTIAAICTALGNGSISIIRISGEKAIDVVNSCFRGKNLKEVSSHSINYGHIVDEEEVIDEVMVSIMKAPKTYTREDVVEINCHGGVLVTKNILSLILRKGIRLAEAGEFTKRAFLNGRIDLSQAEAVMDLINAKNQLAIKSSVNQISGRVNKIIREIREDILTKIAYIEACLDDPEHYNMIDYTKEIREDILEKIKILDKFIDDTKNGSVIKNGIKTSIIGLPNAGKSSLLNYLAKRDRAIVTDIAGTTRDIIEEEIILGDILLNIIDTAGIRKTDDIVESIGVKKALDTIENSDLVLYVIDSTKDINEDNIEIFNKLNNKKYVAILNKVDGAQKIKKEDINNFTKDVVEISLVNEIGLEELKKMIYSICYSENIMYNDEIYIANDRQLQLLIDSKDALIRTLESIDLDMTEDFISIDLTEAYQSLGKIIGEEVEEDIIDKIFKDFCMGK